MNAVAIQRLRARLAQDEPFKSPVLFHTTYLECLKQNVKIFIALDFIVAPSRRIHI